MTIHDATEAAYKNGYEQGKKDALKWIPVTERLPIDEWNKTIRETDADVYACLAVVKHRLAAQRYVAKLFFTGENFIDFEGVYYTENVTHWMPLPPAPKEDA